MNTEKIQSPRLKAHPSFPFKKTAILGIYDARQVTTALILNSQTPMLSKLTEHQQVLARRPQACFGLEGPVLSLLLEWLPIFDSAFFFNALNTHLRGLKVFDDDSWNSKNGFFDKKTGTININLAVRGVKGQSTHRYVAVLLHEMVHAFQYLYSCGMWQRCPSKCETYVTKGTHIGKTGHGELWCEAMIAIKQSFEKALRWEVDCGFPQSVQNEINWGWSPSDSQLLSFGLKLSESETKVMPIETQKGKRQVK
jgi:hypothetical protein